MKRPPRNPTRARIAHAIAGFTLGLEGWEKLENHEPVGAVIMLCLAVLLVFYARFHPRLHHSARARHFETAVFVVEAAALAVVSATFFAHGKHLLPWLYAVLVLVYLALAILHHKRGPALA